MITVWHQSTARAIWMPRIRLLSYSSRPSARGFTILSRCFCHVFSILQAVWAVQPNFSIIKTKPFKVTKYKQSVSGVTTICLTQCNTSPSHRVDQVVDCGLWNVGPLLFNGCAKLLDIGRKLEHAVVYADPEHPKHAHGWHFRWVCWPCKNWDVFSFQELCTDPWQSDPCVQILGAVHYHAATWGDGRGWMAQQRASGSRHGNLCALKMPSIKCTCVRCP